MRTLCRPVPCIAPRSEHACGAGARAVSRTIERPGPDPARATRNSADWLLSRPASRAACLASGAIDAILTERWASVRSIPRSRTAALMPWSRGCLPPGGATCAAFSPVGRTHSATISERSERSRFRPAYRHLRQTVVIGTLPSRRSVAPGRARRVGVSGCPASASTRHGPRKAPLAWRSHGRLRPSQSSPSAARAAPACIGSAIDSISPRLRSERLGGGRPATRDPRIHVTTTAPRWAARAASG